jgi:HEAT repeat protein
LGGPRVVERLLSILRSIGSIDYRLFRAACEALEQLAHTHLEMLIEALKNEKHHIALSHLVETLGRTHDARVVEPLFRVDRGLFLQRDVIGDDEGFVADEINAALREIGSPAVDFLIPMLRDPDETVRRRAACDLSIMKDPRATAPLLERLQDSSEDVRRAAIFAFRLVWDARVVEPLIALLRDPSPDIRQEAACALGRIGDPKALEPLIKALRDRNMWVRDEAVEALQGIGDRRAVEPLITMLRNRHREIRIGTISVLGQFNDKRAIEPLIRMLRDRDYGVRRWAVGTLWANQLKVA